MKNFILILFAFLIVNISGDHIYLYSDNEFTSGSDADCEAFENQLKAYSGFKYVHIVNKSWVPSRKLIQNF